ncbi:MAG: alpha/beta fold hydrolase [Parvibaculum sp.]|uniref:alpha/beta fold hydrolase n=1 Tax=Parvibaculum sp. TaxID=2024848 RepID=UPI00283B96DB|nr:alpha/beta fold hydrolase [Parvibaculum sp.]MDR3498786.1 alpha/beta fold hydrolase [Parvibaculum sp.]
MARTGIDLGSEAAESTVALNPIVGIAREDLIGAVGAMLRETAGQPIKTLGHLKNFGGEFVRILKNDSDLVPDAKDKRFADPAWTTNPLYKASLQTYLAIRKSMRNMIDEAGFDELERARASFVSGMILDALSPTNTLIGNPAALKKALDSGGVSLIRGLKNAYEDMTKNDGIVSQVDKRPFKVGGNLATSEGSVVYRTEMMELIQYAPTTAEVRETPLLIIPPQINKAYVNDLSPQKSIVKLLTGAGIQTFLVSWRNPTAEHRAWGLGDYVDALIEASDVVCRIAKSKTLNVSGACSGGITAATLLSKLAAKNDKRVASVTLMVCVLDPQPSDSETGALLSKHGVEMARRRSAKAGVLKGSSLSRTFAWLRANDLVWNYVINNYLLGEDPPAFDVLFWNNDSTNLPAALHSDYLRVYEEEPFAKPGTVTLADHKVDLRKVTQDCFVVAGVTDHITPWKACYRSAQLLGSPNIDFVLSQAGHIQALLNPPGNPKAKYFHGAGRPPASTDEWMASHAQEHQGSWWPLWTEWLIAHAGNLKPAPKSVGSRKYPAGDPAPGTYVFG